MANSKKALDENGVLYLWGKVKTYVATAIANIKLPSKTSDLTNDSGFITAKDVPEGAAASSTVPKMDGTAAAGTETAFARGDHVHPSDTTKVDKVEGKGPMTTPTRKRPSWAAWRPTPTTTPCRMPAPPSREA